MKKGIIKLSDKDLKSKKSASSESAYTLPSAPDYESMSEKEKDDFTRGGDFSFIPSYAGGERGKQYERFGEQEPSAPQRKSALNMLGVSSPLNKRGLWDNIHAKRKRGEKMRKKGDPGAPTDKAIKDSQ